MLKPDGFSLKTRIPLLTQLEERGQQFRDTEGERRQGWECGAHQLSGPLLLEAQAPKSSTPNLTTPWPVLSSLSHSFLLSNWHRKNPVT